MVVNETHYCGRLRFLVPHFKSHLNYRLNAVAGVALSSFHHPTLKKPYQNASNGEVMIMVSSISLDLFSFDLLSKNANEAFSSITKP